MACNQTTENENKIEEITESAVYWLKNLSIKMTLKNRNKTRLGWLDGEKITLVILKNSEEICYLSGFKLNCLKQTSLSRERFDNNPSMTNIFTKPCENKTVPIRNLSRKIITKFHLLIKLQTYKMPNVAKGKRKGSEVTTPSGLTPKNKTTNTGNNVY